MIFEVKKDKFFSAIFSGVFLFLGIMIMLFINSGGIEGNTLSFIFAVLGLFIIVWVWYVTDYKMKNNLLSVRSGPLSENIPILSISKVKIGEVNRFKNLLGLSLSGVIVHYNKNDVVYITPQNQDKFCKSLKMIHKKIVIEKN